MRGARVDYHQGQTQDKIVSVSTLDWPLYTGSEVARGGATTEAVRAAFAKVGYEINVAYRPWKRAIDMAKKGTDDVTNLKKLVRKWIDAVVIDKLVL